jgi:hypothetical protein
MAVSAKKVAQQTESRIDKSGQAAGRGFDRVTRSRFASERKNGRFSDQSPRHRPGRVEA